MKGTDRIPQEMKGPLGEAGSLGSSEDLGRLPWPQGFLEHKVPGALVTVKAMNARTRDSGSPSGGGE